ncbi:MAG: amidohydrolase family protein [Chloroflexota bacterium]
MIIDMSAYIGRWPFAPLGYESADDLLRLMDRAGVDKAAITSLNSIFYYDAEIGNREVGAACRQHPNRLIPMAAINPNLPRWREHLTACVEQYGARGIRLHPDFHKYSLLAEHRMPDIGALMAEAAQRGLPVFVQTSILDMRHYPGYCMVEEAPIAQVAQAIERYRDNTFIVGGARWFRARANELIKHARAANLTNHYIATDGLGGYWDGLGSFVQQIGGERLLFTSRAPILYGEAARLVVETSEISAEDQANILGGNAARLLGLA